MRAYTRQQPASSSQPRLGKACLAFIARRNKKLKRDQGLRDWSEAELPTALTTDEGYSTLDHMVDTPMGNVVLKSLRKKGADVRFMCSEVCSAAVEEGSQKYSTRLLSRIRDERAFHNKLAKFLPRVEKLKFPAQIKKKLVMKDFSACFAIELPS